MNSTLLKRLFRAIQSGSDSDMDSLCRRIVEEEKKSGHIRVAEDLERILAEERKQRPLPLLDQANSLTPLPTNRRDSAPLLQEFPVESLRHHMVLPESVERRFQRVESEFAARSRLAKYGLRHRHRILLYGPPGCGKSLGAERLAWNTGLPLRKVRFDTLLSSYFGETMTNLRKVFDAAQASPCALFLDECDTLARSRMARNDVGEVGRITNALLEMLEHHTGKGIIIAATNLDTELDNALFRRFDEVLKVPLPGYNEILQLLHSTLSAIETDNDVNWGNIAQSMDGMSGAEVVQVAQNAAKFCILEGRKKVTELDVRFALKEIYARHHEPT